MKRLVCVASVVALLAVLALAAGPAAAQKDPSIKDIMTKDPTCCVPSDSAQRAAITMRNEHVGIVPVIENEQSRKVVLIGRSDGQFVRHDVPDIMAERSIP